MKHAMAFLVLAAMAGAAAADEIRLRNGGILIGIARVEGDTVVVELGIGTARMPREEVLEIVPGRCALHEYAERCAEVDRAPSAATLYDLLTWARDNGLSRYVPGLFRRIIELEPAHRPAREALGHVLHGGTWMTKVQQHQALGRVEFRGRWLRPEARDRIVADEARSRAGKEQARAASHRAAPPRPVEANPYLLGLPRVPVRSSQVSTSADPWSTWDAPFWWVGAGTLPQLNVAPSGGNSGFQFQGR